MLDWLLELAKALKPYTQVFEYLLLLMTAIAAVYATRRIKAGTKEVRQLVDASERLRAQADETASLLSSAADDAIERMRASLNEEIITASLGQATQGAVDRVRTSVSAPHDDGTRAPAATTHQSTIVGAPDREAHRQWWQPVVDTKLPGSDQQPMLYWKNNIRVPLPWPGTWLTVWHNEEVDGVCGVAVSGKPDAVNALWRHLQPTAADLLALLPANSTVKSGRFGIGVTKPNDEFRNDDDRRSPDPKAEGLNAFARRRFQKSRHIRHACGYVGSSPVERPPVADTGRIHPGQMAVLKFIAPNAIFRDRSLGWQRLLRRLLRVDAEVLGQTADAIGIERAIT
jgi:hypothetical protein